LNKNKLSFNIKQYINFYIVIVLIYKIDWNNKNISGFIISKKVYFNMARFIEQKRV